jgi:uncharacterized protein (DUF302 family)
MLLAVVLSAVPAWAQEGRVTLASRAPFARVAEALEQAVAAQRMVLVCHANAQRGAAARGVAIRGNQVLMVFRNDFAVRLIEADPRAAFEAPIRIYVYENPDGTATVSYVRPSTLLAGYGHPDVRAVGAELDPIFEAIVDQAVAAR